ARPHQDTGVILTRIGKDLAAADGQAVHRANGDNGRRAARGTPAILQQDPELAHGKGQAGQHHEAREVAPRDVFILGPVDGEITPPARLRAVPPAIRRDTDALAFRYAHAVPSWAATNASQSMFAISNRIDWPMGGSLMASVTST